MSTDESNPIDQLQETLKQVREGDLQEIYFNGFVNALGTGDIIIVLLRNNRPVAALNASYTTAKTLTQKLGYLVAQLEEKTGNTIMTTDNVSSKIQ